ncbi:MAG TPA: GerMN domain-containing protein, partial [Thermoanaerobaculia bacterium]|nr:GerMN domain-containing protein [Thermoanaerobaculia bacterium]
PGTYFKALFEELHRGPQREGLASALPEKIALRNAFLLADGTVVLDLAVDSGLAFGSDEELTIVAALVDTTLQNVADTARVRILVNGEPAETLGGHVDLTRPLLYLRDEVAP